MQPGVCFFRREYYGKDKGNIQKMMKKVLLFFTVLLMVLIAGWYVIMGGLYQKLTFREVKSVSAAPYKEEGVINILLIGSDSRDNSVAGRSDAMILLSVSDKTKTIHMTSLLRDMYVEIPGHEGNRLNAAYSYGGAELLMQTVEHNFGIPVNRCAIVNFQAFANLVDTVGGVDLELSNEEVKLINGYLVEYNQLANRPEGTDYLDPAAAGVIHLNGPQALAYSRNRYIGTDFGRTQRQRKVLGAVIGSLPGAILRDPAALIDGVLSNLTTNLKQHEVFTLSLQAWKLLAYDMVSGSIPLEGTYRNANIRGMAVLEVDLEANQAYLQSALYGN